MKLKRFVRALTFPLRVFLLLMILVQIGMFSALNGLPEALDGKINWVVVIGNAVIMAGGLFMIFI